MSGINGSMYLRQSTQKRADGSTLRHLQIAENVWDPAKKRSRVRILYNCGRADDPKATERLRRLARSILKRCSPEELIAADSTLTVADLLNLDVELVFYDTTSLHFEIADEDAEDTEGPPLRKRGHSKNGRGDAPQVLVGLAVTREGFPVRHWVFPGNTVELSTVAKVKRDLKGWRRTPAARRPFRCVFVGDAGMVSAENLKALARGGGRYAVCKPVHRGGEADQVIGRRGRYRQVAENLQVKEVVVGEGERRRRYAVCFNPREAERQRRHRAKVLAELEAELASLRPSEGGHRKRACELRASGRYGRYLRLTKTGLLRIDRAKVKAAERLDGKFVVHSNDDTLQAEDMALGYKQLQRVEQAWRRLKSGLKLRPVYHRAERRIRAHVALSVIALLLERMAEYACGDTWRNIRDDLKRIKLVQLSGPNGALWQVTEPRKDASKRLKSLRIPPPPPILKLG